MVSLEDSDDELHDYEYPDEPDDDCESLTVTCAECKAEIFEDAEQCPHCGTYVTDANGSLSGLPKAWMVFGLIGTLAVIIVIFAIAMTGH